MLAYGDWLKRARHFRKISANDLAKGSGLSLSYIQRIEGGSRVPSEAAMSEIHKVLGFTPADASLDLAPLEDKMKMLQCEKGDSGFCTLEYVFIDGRPIYTDCNFIDKFDEVSPEDADNIIRLKHAAAIVRTQRFLLDDEFDLRQFT